MILEIGSVINKTYRIEKYVGEGSMGKIYLIERIKDKKKLLAEEIAGPLNNCRILFKEIFSAEGSDDMSFLRKYGFFKSNLLKNSQVPVTDEKRDNYPENGGTIVLPLLVIGLLLITICGLLLGLSLPGFLEFLYY